MRKTLTLLALIALAGPGLAQPMPPVDVPGVGKVVLVNRDQLRFTMHARTMRTAQAAPWLAALAPPTTFDHTKGGTLKFPILGNDHYGDCYYAATAHAAQTYTGNAGAECSFDVNKLTRRYLQIAGGDNGLYDELIFKEWKGGIVGPSGPHKILDELVVDPKDHDAQRLACWAFGGLIWTCSLESGWTNNARPGAVWGAHEGRSVGGHAMFITGKNGKGDWDVQTWGVGPPYIQVTPAGVADAQSEFVVAFSLDQFKPDGFSAFTGLHYEDMANLWESLGGQPLPPSPFPPAPRPAPPKEDGSNLKPVLASAGVLLLLLLIAALVGVIRRRRVPKVG